MATRLLRGARVALSACLAVALASACFWGTRPQRFAPARGPDGATVLLRTQRDGIIRRGELFAVDSVGVIVRTDRLLSVPWNRVAEIEVLGLDGAYDVARGEVVDPAKRARLALVSRFPQGLADELLRRVLATVGQTAIEVVP
jgi:hypothetical protein